MKRTNLILFEVLFMTALFFFLAFDAIGAAAQGREGMTGMAHMAPSGHASARLVDIVRDPADVPPPVGNRPPTTVKVDLTAVEVVGQLDPSARTTYRYWTFNGKVPAPMIRVRQGDTIEVTLHNSPSSHMVHSIDFHAAIGPGGGAALSQVTPGQQKTFSFVATTPGLFVYHCGTPMIADHIANGMYGLILVEPAAGLPRVDHEYYVMQGEVYTAAPKGNTGLQNFSEAKLAQEAPEYFVFNGAVDALTKRYPLKADAGQTVRIFFGDAGPNQTSSLHVAGEIFTSEYQLGSLTSPALHGVQTASIPPGGAAILELKAAMPGQFNFMDHAMARMAKGLMGTIDVSGRESAALMKGGPASEATRADADRESVPDRGDRPVMSPGPADSSRSTPPVQAMTPADSVGFTSLTTASGSSDKAGNSELVAMKHPATSPTHRRSSAKLTELDGCVTLEGQEVRLATLQSGKIYRLQAMPPFADNIDRIMHVTGHLGSVAPVSDPRIPTFAVDTADALAPNCHLKVSPERLREIQAKYSEAPASAVVVGMSDMSFARPNITINAGQTVVWKNTSGTAHNVVDDAAQAITAADVRLPAGVKPFGSGYLQPGQSYSRTFTVPGTYRYVCTLHETAGMKGVIVVKPSAINMASARTR